MRELELISDGAVLRGTETGDGPTVLLLHAGGERRTVWEPVARALDEGGVRSVAFDQRGHGDSTGEPTTLAMLAADVRAMIRQQRRPVTIVGGSIGGLAGLDALTDPATAIRVRGLVLVDVVPDPDPGRVRAWLDEQGLRRRRGPRSSTMCSPGGRRSMRPWPRGPADPARARRGRLAAQRRRGRRLQETNPRVRVEQVPEAGHLVARDAPARLAAIILETISSWHHDRDPRPPSTGRPVSTDAAAAAGPDGGAGAHGRPPGRHAARPPRAGAPPHGRLGRLAPHAAGRPLPRHLRHGRLPPCPAAHHRPGPTARRDRGGGRGARVRVRRVRSSGRGRTVGTDPVAVARPVHGRHEPARRRAAGRLRRAHHRQRAGRGPPRVPPGRGGRGIRALVRALAVHAPDEASSHSRSRRSRDDRAGAPRRLRVDAARYRSGRQAQPGAGGAVADRRRREVARHARRDGGRRRRRDPRLPPDVGLARRPPHRRGRTLPAMRASPWPVGSPAPRSSPGRSPPSRSPTTPPTSCGSPRCSTTSPTVALRSPRWPGCSAPVAASSCGASCPVRAGCRGSITSPEPSRALARFPDLAALTRLATDAGLRPVAADVIVDGEPRAPADVAAWITAMRHADSLLTALTDDEIATGLAALRRLDGPLDPSPSASSPSHPADRGARSDPGDGVGDGLEVGGLCGGGR